MDQNNNEDVILNDNNEGENLANQVQDENVKKSLETEIARKKHWREKFEKEAQTRKDFEEKYKKQEEELTKFKSSNNTSPDIQKDVQELKLQNTKLKFGRTHGQSDEETDFVFASANGLGLTPEQAKDNPFVKTAIESMRSQRRAENATPRPSSSVTFEGGKKWDEMNEAERKKNFGQFSKSF